MEMPVQCDQDGYPLLDQFSADGFVDCTFRITRALAPGDVYRLHLSASHKGEVVGVDVVVVKGIRGGFDADMGLIREHVYRSGVRFIRSGPESDRLLTVLAELYGFGAEPRCMVAEATFTAIALHQDNVDLKTDETKIKLFGRDADSDLEDDYFESFFNLDLKGGFVFWNEKDPDYRAPLLRGLSVPK